LALPPPRTKPLSLVDMGGVRKRRLTVHRAVNDLWAGDGLGAGRVGTRQGGCSR
jgi:hypothetical protein